MEFSAFSWSSAASPALTHRLCSSCYCSSSSSSFSSCSSSFFPIFITLCLPLNNLGLPLALRCGEWASRQWITSRTTVNPDLYPPSAFTLPSCDVLPTTSFVVPHLKSLLRMITGAPSSLIKPPGSLFMAKCHPAPRVFSLTRTSFSFS